MSAPVLVTPELVQQLHLMQSSAPIARADSSSDDMTRPAGLALALGAVGGVVGYLAYDQRGAAVGALVGAVAGFVYATQTTPLA